MLASTFRRLAAILVAVAVLGGVVAYVLWPSHRGSVGPASPFPVGVIYGTKDQWGSGGPSDPPYRTPTDIERYYQPWLDGSGTGHHSAVTISATRVGINSSDLAGCGSSPAGPLQSCFTAHPLSAWAPGSPGHWKGVVDLEVPMLTRVAPPASLVTRSARKTIKLDLEWGAYGTGTKVAPGAFPYTINYRNLASALVGAHLSSAYIDIDPESEGSWNNTQFGPDPAAWAKYYDNIHDDMLSVPGAHFRFVWTTGLFVSTTSVNGKTKPSVDAAFPGDADVDVVSLDWHDNNFGTVEINGREVPEPYSNGDCTGRLPRNCHLTTADWTRAWTSWYLPAAHTAQSVYGLQWWSTFAQSHRKQFGFSSWGLDSGGDNAYLIQQVWLWLDSLPHGSIAFAIYDTDPTDSYYTDPHGPFGGTVLTGTQRGVSDGTIYKAAPCEYRKWFGQLRSLKCEA